MAKRIVDTLVTELTADGAKMRAEFAKSQRDMQTWGNRMTSIAKSAALGLGVAAIGAGTSLAVLTKNAINNADALSKQSKIVGVAIEDLAGLDHAAKLAGVSNEQLGTGLKIFSKNMFDALNGVGRGAEAMDLLGISITKADGTLRSNYELMQDVADAFALMQDGATKTALAQNLFGKSGAQMIPLLNGGRQAMQDARLEAERLGKVISQETGEAAERFNDNLTKMGDAIDGLGLKIATKSLPALIELTDTINDPATQENIATLVDGFVQIGAVLVAGVGKLGEFSSFINRTVNGADPENLRQVNEEISEIQELLANPVSARLNPLSGISPRLIMSSEDELKAQLERLFRYRDELIAKNPAAPLIDPKAWDEEKFLNEVSLGVMELKLKKKLELEEQEKQNAKAIAEAAAEQKRLNALYESEMDTLRRQAVLVGEVSEVQRLRYEFEYGALKDVGEQQKNNLLAMADELDFHNEVAMAVAKKASALEALKGVEQTLKTEVERVNDAWDARIKIIQESGLEEAKATELIAKAEQKRADELKAINEKGTDAMTEYSRQAARNMQSAFADFLFDPFEDGLDGMAKKFGQILQRMAAEAAAAQIFNAIGSWGQNNANAGGWVGAAAGIASMFGGAYAEGGRPPTGKISVVGDGGEPELFVPDTAGTIIPFSKLQGGGTSIGNVNMSFPGVTNAREAELATGAAARKLMQMANAGGRYS